eukprot:TRINITY_DN1440_c0_g1_i8.p4 TRINITY_DN1440_c0_g1~~TRINITY_DN1440_c0_g1_i8.p4  ORF type:complete len:325 (+),score=52.42 TRINITY_DN1440_c0_g1_i8:2237-3211(+)
MKLKGRNILSKQQKKLLCLLRLAIILNQLTLVKNYSKYSLKNFPKIAIQEEQYFLAYKILSFVEKASKNITILKDLLYSQEEITKSFPTAPPKPFKIENIGTRKQEQLRQSGKKQQPQNYFKNEPIQNLAQNQFSQKSQYPPAQQQSQQIQPPISKSVQQVQQQQQPQNIQQQEESKTLVKKSPFGQPFAEAKPPAFQEQQIPQNQFAQMKKMFHHHLFPSNRNNPHKFNKVLPINSKKLHNHLPRQDKHSHHHLSNNFLILNHNNNNNNSHNKFNNNSSSSNNNNNNSQHNNLNKNLRMFHLLLSQYFNSNRIFNNSNNNNNQ